MPPFSPQLTFQVDPSSWLSFNSVPNESGATDASFNSLIDGSSSQTVLTTTDPGTDGNRRTRYSTTDSTGSDLSNASSEELSSEDPWSRRHVWPSSKFPSKGINPKFNLWSPSTEDDYFLRSDISRPESTTTSSSSFADISWGSFQSLEKVCTEEEAEVMHNLEEQETVRRKEEATEKKKKKQQDKRNRFLANRRRNSLY